MPKEIPIWRETLLGVVLATVLAASAAQAADSPTPPLRPWQWCWGKHDTSFNVYVFGPYKVDPNLAGFPDAKVVAALGDTRPKCHLEVSPAAAEDHVRRAFTPETTVHRVSANTAAVPARSAPAPKPAAGALTVEDNGVTARTAAWADTLLQAKREEASRQVKLVIETAQSKAEYERILAEAKARAKKQGRRQ